MTHAASPATFGVAVVIWQAMIVGMMTPTVLPWVAAYGRLVAPPPSTGTWRSSVPFVAGYFTIWLAYSVVAASLQVALASTGLLHADVLGARFGGLVLIAAGAFQFAPLKTACLAHCRNPLSYFLAHWKHGPIGGFRLGLAHGAYCVGCCWLLMLTGFAVGVMNLAWMAVLTLVVVLEQVVPWGKSFGRVAGAGLLVWGTWVLASP